MVYNNELFSKELGERLKQMREDRGLSLRAMVRDHDFHATHWQGFEKGKGISIPSLLKVCETFDILLEDLVRGLGHSGARGSVGPKKRAKTAVPHTSKRSKTAGKS